MKKENILVILLGCIAVIAVVIYFNNRPSNHANATHTNQQTNTPAREIQADMKPPAAEKTQTIVAAKRTGIDWQAYRAGLDMAKTQNKPVFLYFHADWCKYCKKLKKETFADNGVFNYLNTNFISITVDTEKNRELAMEWGVKGLPSLWFLKADNSKISNIPGYVGPEQFLHVLKYIHTESYEKMSFPDFVETLKG